jgi:hypothetical protein
MESKQDRKGSEGKKNVKLSPVPEIPMLELDLRTNLSNIIEVKNALVPYSFREFRTLGNCIEDMELNDIPQMDASEAGSSTEFGIRLKKQLDREELRQAELVRLYGIILGCLSITSKEKVFNSEEFQRIRTTNNGFNLWKLVYTLHASGREGASIVERFNQAERNYVNCIQRENETLADFYQRFNGAVNIMRQYNGSDGRPANPTNETAAVRFLNNLNRSHYGELQRMLHNTAAYPTTLPKALERAGTYEPISRPVKGDRVQYGAAVFNNSRKKTSKADTHNSEDSNEVKETKQKGSKPAFKGKCFNCGKIGHRQSDCRSLKKNATPKSNYQVGFDSDEEEKCNFTILSGMKGGRNFDSFDLLLDSGAQVSVVNNPQLLTNLRTDKPIVLFGMDSSGDGIPCNMIGDLLNFGVAYLCENAQANLLSLASARPHCSKISFDNRKNCYELVDKKSAKFKFNENDSVYKCNVRRSYAFELSKREIESSKFIREIQRRLAFESSNALKIGMRNGSFLEMPASTRDVDNADAYWGPDIGMLKGKATAVPPKSFPLVEVPQLKDVPQTLEIDLLYVDRHLFLGSVSDPLDLVMVNYLNETPKDSLNPKQMENVRRHLFNQLDAYKNQGFKISCIKFDSDAVFKSIAPDVTREGIKVMIAPPGRHGIPRMDRKIRMVKERCRCILSTLPYDLPSSLIPWVVKFVVSRLNLIRRNQSSSTSTESPKEAFTGRKTNFNADVNIGFGDYVQVRDVNQDNSMKERTISCIALLPLSDGSGSVKFYCLKTGSVVVRDAWINVPIPDTVVEHLNAMANSSLKRLPRRDPTFNEHPDAREAASDKHSDAREAEGGSPPDFEESAPVPDEREGDAEPVLGDPDPVSEEREDSDTVVDAKETDVAEESPHDQPDNNLPETDQPLDISGPNIVESVRSRGNRFGFRRFFEREERRAFNLSVREALKQHGDEAAQAIMDEMKQMVDKAVWTPIHWREANAKMIPSKMFLKEKKDSHGNVIKIKSRLVAGGHLQNRDDFQDLSSPTLSFPTLLILSLIAAKYGHHVATADITGAYLNADMNDHVLMNIKSDLAQYLVRIDSNYLEYLNEKGDLLVKLQKALYGCVQSSKLWYLTLKKVFEEDGFTCSTNDPCVFVKRVGDVLVIVSVYVDDIILQSDREEAINEVINLLKVKFHEIKVNRGKKHQYLGMLFDFSNTGRVNIKMTGYIEDILEKMGVSGTATTPANRDLFTLNDAELVLDEKGQAEVRSLVYQLLYVCTRVVPEALLAVNFLCSRVGKFCESDKKKIMRILQYLNGRKGVGINLSCEQDIHVYIYADASYAPHADARSQTGTVVRIGDSSIICKSSKQKLVTKSSTEAELVGAVDSVQQLYPIRGLLSDLGVNCNKYLLLQDNMSTISLIRSTRPKSLRSRHINVRYHYLQERISMGEFDVAYVPTNEMLADIFTKPLQGNLFRTLRDRLIG